MAVHGGTVPADVQARIAAEERHIFGNGYGTLLAVAAKLAEFSESRGCPVGFRGLTGNLYLAYLLGLAAIDPMELGLRWEGCLGLDGTRAPQFTLNVAGGLLEDMTAYLGEILDAGPSVSRDDRPAFFAFKGDCQKHQPPAVVIPGAHFKNRLNRKRRWIFSCKKLQFHQAEEDQNERRRKKQIFPRTDPQSPA